MGRFAFNVASVVFFVLLIAGCSDHRTIDPELAIDDPEEEFAELMALETPAHKKPAPSPIINLDLAWGQLSFWPFTGENFSGNPQDPINLIFVGEADPRDIRAALLSLDGDRSDFPFPPIEPFTSTWDDAIGDVQVSYGGATPTLLTSGSESKWAGGAIQLACGPYEQLRVHLRLFEIGGCTIANAHFETLITGTEQHQVLSWELAEQLVVADFIRSGLLDPTPGAIDSVEINPAPFREIPAIVYNLLPEGLKQLIGGPPGQVNYDVPILTDGSATILPLIDRVTPVTESRDQNMTVYYNQTVPKPFCSAGPGDYIYVTGEIHMTQSCRINSTGSYSVAFFADGNLTATPVNPLTGEFTGDPMIAYVNERHNGRFSDFNCSASSIKFQRLGRGNDDAGGRYFSRLICNSNNLNSFYESLTCNSGSGFEGEDSWASDTYSLDARVLPFGTK